MKEWNVYVSGRCIGTVFEGSEALARCAALSAYGITEEEIRTMKGPHGSDLQNFILPEADFSVSAR